MLGADTRVLFRRRPHQRDVGVVLVEQPVLEPGGDRLRSRRSSPCRAPRWTPPAGSRPRPAAVRRSGPALRKPPTCSSASSVVVRSSTPAMSPSSMSDSMACPPLPVAWKTRTSQPARSSVSRARSTHAVVTPNIVAATSGLSFASRLRSRMRHEAGHRPRRLREHLPAHAVDARAMSTTELSMKMSLSPTNCRTMPDASVLTMTFGTPSGSARIAAVRDGRSRRSAQAKDARHLAPRVRFARQPCRACGGLGHGLAAVGSSAAPLRSSSPPARRSARADTSAATAGVPSAPTSTRVTATPHDVRSPRTKSASRPFVSSVAKRKTDGISLANLIRKSKVTEPTEFTNGGTEQTETKRRRRGRDRAERGRVTRAVTDTSGWGSWGHLCPSRPSPLGRRPRPASRP